MNKAEFLFEIYKYLKVWSFDIWVWFVLQVGIAKTRARILLKLLSGVFNLKETHTTRVVLIFSQSCSSHGLEVSATDDLRRAATKLTIKVCRFRA